MNDPCNILNQLTFYLEKYLLVIKICEIIIKKKERERDAKSRSYTNLSEKYWSPDGICLLRT